ncbi:MAG: hypothetical protein ACJZ82_02600 [Paracoccaceae bacterium]
MANLSTNISKKLLASLILIFFSIMGLAAIAEEDCKSLQSNSDFCQKKGENLHSINLQFDKAFSAGGVVNISQPPLVIIPEIEINVPTALGSDKTINLRPKTAKRLKLEKNLDKNYFTKIVEALDKTGKKHLSQCMSKISDDRLKNHYPDFVTELNALKTITFPKQEKFNKIGFLLSKSPSQKDCFKYLDFILMIS